MILMKRFTYSDRILVLRSNPGEIDELIEVPVPRPRDPGQFLTPNFLPPKNDSKNLSALQN